MSITLSNIAHTQLNQTYLALDGILAKAAAHAEENKIDEAVYLNWRIAPNMFALTRQIQLVSDFTLRGLSRLAGQDPVSLPDEETSFEDLRERLQKAYAAIQALPGDAIDADPEDDITFPAGPGKEMTLTRQAYLQNFVLSNAIFHTTTAYNILREIGVPLGKADFMGVRR
jgi:hypothetical protein